MITYFCCGTLESEEIHVLGPDIDHWVPHHVVHSILECDKRGGLTQLVEALTLAKVPEERIIIVLVVCWCLQDT